jgi:hypothetical protein
MLQRGGHRHGNVPGGLGPDEATSSSREKPGIYSITQVARRRATWTLSAAPEERE